MDQNEMALTARRMTASRAVLVRDYPFFGHLSLRLQFACAHCGTACTDGERLIVDPEFAKQLTTNREMDFLILHEVLHCVLEHCTRDGNRKPELYNIACDIVVNSTILGMWGLSTFRMAGESIIHLAPDGCEGREYSTEEIYHMLLSQNDIEGQTLDRHDIWQSIRQKERLRDAWNQKIVETAAACEGIAHLPQSVRKIAEDLMRRGEVDWKQVLHDFIQYDSYDYSFLPPDRRFSDRDFFLPAYNINHNQGSPHDIWVCVDTSGSISDEQLTDVLLETRDAIRQTGLTGAISFFDAEITPPKPFDTEEEFQKIAPTGGGTNFHVIFRYLQEKLSTDLPKAILVFTDGYVLDWPKEEDAMDVPVLWLICKKRQPLCSLGTSGAALIKKTRKFAVCFSVDFSLNIRKCGYSHSRLYPLFLSFRKEF